jgi:hypothetical protein
MEVDKGKIKIDISWEFVMKFIGIEGVFIDLKNKVEITLF